MKSTKIISRMLLTVFSACLIVGGVNPACAQGGSWTTKAPMPTARSGAVAGVINGQLYVMQGGGNPPPEFPHPTGYEAYDPVTDTWTTKASAPQWRSYAGAGVINNKLYVVGGCIFSDCIPGNTGLLEVYDAAMNTWTTKSPMPSPRSAMGVGVIGGKLYVVGGYQQCGPCTPLTTLEVYDPATDTWSTKAPMPTAQAQCTASVVNGVLYVIGGFQSGYVIVGTVQAYDPVTDSWTTKASMPTPRNIPAAAVIDGIIYLIGGHNGSDFVSTVEAYSALTDNWTTMPPMPTARYSHVAGAINNVLYAVGGSDSSGAIATNEEFTPEAAADTTPPLIACPADTAVPCSVDLLVPVAFSVTATDDVDPSPTVTSTPPSGSLFPVGQTTINSTATDASGNPSYCTFTVTRAPLGFAGFLSPIGGADTTGGSFASPVRTFKMGSTIPVKFTASCGGSAVLTGVHRLQAVKYSDSTTAAAPIDATPQDAATTGNQFRLAEGQWHFNLDTKCTGMSAGIWLLRATLSDGSQHSVWIQIK